MSGVWPYVAAILPTILVAIFFYFLVKSMLEGDRRERMAQKKYEQEQDPGARPVGGNARRHRCARRGAGARAPNPRSPGNTI